MNVMNTIMLIANVDSDTDLSKDGCTRCKIFTYYVYYELSIKHKFTWEN